MAGEQRTCGNYVLVERIAKGGMAEVYLGRTTGAFGVDRLVAVKMLLPMRAESKQFVAMFIDEARLAVQLTHVNIVRIFELGVSEGRYYIAMEYVPGSDLAEVLKRLRGAGERMPATHAVYIAHCVCAALDYAHSRVGSDGAPLNIVHRDVSPQNILIGDEGGVKVADFGIALSNVRLTQTVGTKLKGKVCYMSPEQAWGRKLDARSDQFSVGTMLYEMLTGVVPFDGGTELDVVYKVRDCQVKPPRELRTEIPEDLEAIVLRAMAADPAHRFANADEMRAALEPFLLSGGRPFGARDLRDFAAGLREGDADKERRHLDDLLAVDGAVEVEAPADWSEIDVTQIIEMELGESAILAVNQPWAVETRLRAVDGDAVRDRAELDRRTRELPEVLVGEDEELEPTRPGSVVARLPTRDVEEVLGEVGTDVFDGHIDDDGTGIARIESAVAARAQAPAEARHEEWTVPDSDQHRLSLLPAVDAEVEAPQVAAPPEPWRRGLAVAAGVLVVVVVLVAVWPSSDPDPAPGVDRLHEASGAVVEPRASEVRPQEPEETAPRPEASRADVVRLRRGLASLLRGRGLSRGDSSQLDEQLARLAVAFDAEEWAQAYEHVEAAMALARDLEVTARMVRAKLARMERRAERLEDEATRARLEAAMLEGRALLEEGDVEEANLRLHDAIVEGFAAARAARAIEASGPAGTDPAAPEPSP